LIIILTIVSSILFVLLCVTSYYLFKLLKILMTIEDNMQDSCDMLDECYSTISEIVQKPLFYDSPEIRNVLVQIEHSRNAVLYVANNTALNNINKKENK